MPTGVLVTVPPPFPTLTTSKLKVCKVNVAVTVLAASIVTSQAPVPEHAPPQPVNVEPVAGVGVSVTTVPML